MFTFLIFQVMGSYQTLLWKDLNNPPFQNNPTQLLILLIIKVGTFSCFLKIFFEKSSFDIRTFRLIVFDNFQPF